MFTVIVALFVSMAAANASPKCETYVPRLDGTAVTVCRGADGVGHVTNVAYVGLRR